MATIHLANIQENFGKLAQQMGDLMDDMIQRNFCRFRSSQRWSPAVNLYEAEDRYVFCVELAGMDRRQINLHLEDRKITISGTRSSPRLGKGQGTGRLHIMEISEGAFLRELPIPPNVDRQRTTASYANGYLWIDLPKLAD